MIDEKSGAHSITAAISEIVYQFERDYRAGLQPVPELYAATLDKQPEYWRLLFELLHSDLELNIRDGNERSVSQYLQRLPDAAGHTTEVISLIEFEIAARVKAGQQPSLEKFQHALPGYQDQLVGIFQRASIRRESEYSTDNSAPGVYDTLPTATGPADSLLSKLQTIGRYRLLRQLGKGGMGSVYEAEDPFLKRRVAIKVPQLRGNEAKRDALLQRFLQEGRAAATLHHPNLCPVFDAGETNGIPFLAMSYISGEPLQNQIKTDKPWDPLQATDLVRKLALALQAAHDKGVIHRDIKPANIILNEKSEPIIIDFGLATPPLGESERITDFGDRFGTIAYMSPEQTSGDPFQVGKRSDIYSLGVVLYELLTGKVPFQGSQADVLVKIRTHTPASPKSLRPEISRQLEQTILRSIAKNPEDRFASMNDFAKALEAHSDTAIAPSLAGNTDLNNRKKGLSLGRIAVYFAAVAIIGLLIFEMFQIIRVSTSNGTIVIDVKDPSAVKEIKIDGNTVQLTALGKKYTVTTGKHRLEVGFNGDKIESKEFTISQGENRTISFGHEFKKEYIDTNNSKYDKRQVVDLFIEKGIDFETNAEGKITQVRIPDEIDGKNIKLDSDDFVAIASIDGLIVLNCDYAGLTADQFRILCRNNTLRSLVIGHASLTDIDLECIVSMKDLREVALVECPFLTDEHMKYLGSIMNLEQVVWTGINITGSGFKHLSKAKNLKCVAVQGTQEKLLSRNIGLLYGVNNLESIVIQGDIINPLSLKHLFNQRNIRSMSISLPVRLEADAMRMLHSFLERNTQIARLELLGLLLSDDDTARIAKSCKNIEALRIRVALQGTDTIFRGQEKELSYLCYLDVSYSVLNNEWCKNIERLEKLVVLSANNTSISRSALLHLAKTNLMELHLNGCKHITDDDLKLLLAIPKLRHVNLVGSNCSKKARDELRIALKARNPGANVIDE